MAQEIYVEVSDLHAEMMDEVKVVAGEDQVRQQTETLIHQLYQQVQQAQAEQELEIEEPEERE
jgi:hypothetical protein